jgi:uncharacterized protein (UPF0332 family)
MGDEAVNYNARAEYVLDHARRSFEHGIYESAAIDAFLAALHAAKWVVFCKTRTLLKKPATVRKRLYWLIWNGLEFDRELVWILKTGHETMLKLDYGPQRVRVTRAKAENYIDSATAFLAAARKVCE